MTRDDLAMAAVVAFAWIGVVAAYALTARPESALSALGIR